MSVRTAIVIGAGALGCACAFALRRGRWRVTLVDPGGPGSASAVAAGMLAPAFESVLDAGDAHRAALLTRARDLWSPFAAAADLPLHREGAAWVGDDACGMLDRLHALGFAAVADGHGVFTTDDWRLDPALGLKHLSAGSEQRLDGAIEARPGRVRVGERWLETDLVVVATGVGALASPEAAPALAAITPIRGQILRLPIAAPPHVLRAESVYLAPSTDGVLVGASMEPGVRTVTPDPRVTAALLTAAARAWPAVTRAEPPSVAVGVRGASPDGLPLVGPVAPKLCVALAPRRNGWLLAPLVAQMIAAYAEGEDPGPYAAVFDPLRFQSR